MLYAVGQLDKLSYNNINLSTLKFIPIGSINLVSKIETKKKGAR